MMEEVSFAACCWHEAVWMCAGRSFVRDVGHGIAAISAAFRAGMKTVLQSQLYSCMDAASPHAPVELLLLMYMACIHEVYVEQDTITFASSISSFFPYYNWLLSSQQHWPVLVMFSVDGCVNA